MKKPASVHIDIAEFSMTVMELSVEERSDWLLSLVKCLSYADPTLNEYGAKLLNEVETYREAERKRKEKYSDKGETRKDTERHGKTEIPKRDTTEQTDRADRAEQTELKQKRKDNGDKSPDIIPDKRNKFSDIDKPENVDQQVWDDFVKNRKARKAPITETAFNKIIVEAKKAGITLNDAIKTAVERNWQSFRAEWLVDKKPKQTGLFGNNCAEQKSELIEAIERRKREDEEKARTQIDDPDLPF